MQQSKSVVSLFLVLAAVACLAGCSTASRPSSCGCLEANCCGWDFYRACDLIEGRADRNCPSICDQPDCQPGVVINRCYAVPVQPAPAAPAAPEELPPPEVIEEPVADLGMPPAGS